MKLQADYYQQFDADYARAVPAEGFGGWQRDSVEIDPARTAVVVMHAVEHGPRSQYPGLYACCDEVPRTMAVTDSVLARLLPAVRRSPLQLFHVAGGRAMAAGCPGYARAEALAGAELVRDFCAVGDHSYEALRAFRRDRAFPGAHNQADCAAAGAAARFPESAAPEGDEGVAVTTRQLAALAADAGVNHLIYAGFNINWCILMSEGGMVEMNRLGYVCSAFRQAVTGVENRESARQELGKELGLWRVSVEYGLVFDVHDFVAAAAREEQR
jgi:hypothetical protein